MVCPLGSAIPRGEEVAGSAAESLLCPLLAGPQRGCGRRAVLPPVELALAEGFGQDRIARSVPGSILNVCGVCFLCNCMEITANLAESSGSYYPIFLLDQMLPVYGWELHWFFFRNSMNPSFLSISLWNEEK